MAPAPKLTVAVLCGGGSRRMGSDKSAMSIDGVAMLDRVLGRITPIAAAVILASGRRRVERPGALTVLDSGRGPLAGIVASLHAAPTELCAVVAADMPDIDPSMLLALVARCAGRDAAVPVSEHGVEPLHAAYARSAIGGLRSALDSSNPSARSGLSRLRTIYVNAQMLGTTPGFARNLNTPGDVSAWLADRGARGPRPR